jgi:hypothetical protein
MGRGVPLRIAGLAVVVMAAACSSKPGDAPRPTAVTPDHGPSTVAVPIRIRGERFGAVVYADFAAGPERSVIDARYRVLLGATPLDDVALRADGTLEATVPAGLAAGAHELTVIDPAGRAGTLAQAYTVVHRAPSPAVTQLRVDPVGPQVVFAPFEVAITVLDAAGAVSTEFGGLARLSDLTGAVVPAVVGPFVDGRWVGAVEVRAAHPADVLEVTVEGGGRGASGPFVVAPAAPASVRFVTPASPVHAGVCTGPVTLSLRDAYGFPTTARGPTALGVGAGAGAGFAAHAHAGCASPVDTLPVAAGQGEASFWFVATRAGALELTAAASALRGDGLATTVVAGPPAALAFVSPPRTAAAGDCSDAATVEVRDAWGNPSSEGVAAVGLAAAPGAGLTLYSDACTTPATSVSVPPGSSAASLRFRGLAPGTLRLDVSAPGLAGASQDAVVVPGPPAALAFATPARAAAAGACSAALVVEARDTLGNPAPVPADVALTLTASPSAGFSLHADPGCAGAGGVALAAGQRAATVYFRGTAAGEVTVDAAAAGLTGASQTERVGPGAPAAIAFASPPQVVAVQACSGATSLRLVDAYGNASPAATPLAISLVAPAGVTFHSDPACAAPVAAATVAAGSDAATFWFEAAAVGTAALGAAASGLVSAAQEERVVAGTASQLVFATAPRTVAAGFCSGAVTLEVRDAYGNPSAPSRTDVTQVSLAAPGLTLYADPACGGAAVTALSLAPGETRASLFFRGVERGAVEVIASATGLREARQAETVVAAAATRIVFTTPAQTVPAGACSVAVAIESRDAYGNPAPLSATEATSLSLSARALTPYADASCSGAPASAVSVAAGAAVASFYFSGTVAGTATITVGGTALTTAVQDEVIVPAPATQLLFATAAQTAVAGRCSGALRLESRDGFGNPVAISAALPTSIDVASPELTLHTDPACATAPVSSVTQGAAEVGATLYFRGTTAGAASVTASGAGLGARQDEEIVPAPAAELVFVTPPRSTQAGACSSGVTVEARDAYGNASAASLPVTLSATALEFHADAGCAGAPATLAPFTAGTARATFYLRGTRAGIDLVIVSASGLAAATQDEVVVAAPASRLAFASAAQRVAAGECSGAVAVEARDPWDNPSIVSSTAVTRVSLSAAGLTFHEAAGCGTSAVTWASLPAGASGTTIRFRGTAAGTIGLTVSAAGLTSSTQDQTIVAAAAERFAWSGIASPQREGAAFPVTVTALDAFGNRAGYAGSVALSASSGSVSCVGACTAPAESASFTDGQWSGTVVVPHAVRGVRLTATGSGGSGSSEPFDVSPARSPPTAVLGASAQVIPSGATVTFDASGSSDFQTPLSSLSVSWDLDATGATQDGGAVPPVLPWTAWSTQKTATRTYVNATSAPVVVRPRLAVRDDEAGPGGPDVAYATEPLIVLPAGGSACVVDTDALDDDNGGSSSCADRGTDGRTSLPEAIRAANASATPLAIAFSGTRHIVGAGGTTFRLRRAVQMVAAPGTVVLEGVTFGIDAPDVLVSGLELAAMPAPLTVTAAGDALLEDLHVHDGEGIEVQGRGRVVHARMSGCAGVACLRANGASAYLAVFSSELDGGGRGVGVALDLCAGARGSFLGSSAYAAFANGWSNTGSAFVGTSVLTRFDTAVAMGAACANPWVSNVTLDRNGTGIRDELPGGGFVIETILSGNTVAMAPATCVLEINYSNLVWGNGSDGCVATSVPTALLNVDPQYVDSSGGDYRLRSTSPARDSAGGFTNIDVNDAGPGRFLGPLPDRGGRETY